MSHSRWSKLWGTLVKLGVTGASLVAVAWAILIVDSGGDVKESTADIVSFDPVPVSNTERFEDTLESLGHSEPRSFDYNGNEVYFSTRVTHEDPERLMREYQQAFVRHGVNEKVYMPYGASAYRKAAQGSEEVSVKDRRDAMLSGQIVPMGLSENYMMMGGGMLKGNAQTRDQLNDYLEEKGFGRFEDEFAAYRQIEAFRDETTNQTTVTASWSNEEFDITKHAENTYPQAEGVSPDTEVPSCLGCKRQMRFTGKQNTKPYTLNNFVGDQSPAEMTEFYDEAMRNRGWRQTRSSLWLQRVLKATGGGGFDGRMLQYSRGNEFLTVFVRRGKSLDKTSVTTYQTD